MTGVRHWSIFFLSGRRTPEVTSDGYHFLILDLHKSEVGPSNLPFLLSISFSFFFSFFFYYFSGPFYPSTPGSKCAVINVTVSQVSRFFLPRVLDTCTTS